MITMLSQDYDKFVITWYTSAGWHNTNGNSEIDTSDT